MFSTSTKPTNIEGRVKVKMKRSMGTLKCSYIKWKLKNWRFRAWLNLAELMNQGIENGDKLDRKDRAAEIKKNLRLIHWGHLRGSVKDQLLVWAQVMIFGFRSSSALIPHSAGVSWRISLPRSLPLSCSCSLSLCNTYIHTYIYK